MNNSPASALPIELWIKIARIICDGLPCGHCESSIDGDPCKFSECRFKDFRAVIPLSESCRYLRDNIQPILYEGINLDLTFGVRVASLTFTLSARPDLRLSVRTLQIRASRQNSALHALLDLLSLLVELRFLSMIYCKINPAIVKFLHGAVHLHTIHIRFCTWAQDLPENWLDASQFGENLKEVTIVLLSSTIGHISMATQLLVPTLKKLQADSHSLAQFMRSSRAPSFGHSLVHLETHVHDQDQQDALIQLLAQCPNITHFKAHGQIEAKNLTANLLPNLQSVNADDSIVSALLPGRAIRSITITPGPKTFAAPLPELQVLHLYAHGGWKSGFRMIHTIVTACPGLLQLELTSGTPTAENYLILGSTPISVRNSIYCPNFKSFMPDGFTVRFQTRRRRSCLSSKSWNGSGK